jgi:hypothetical protein
MFPNIFNLHGYFSILGPGHVVRFGFDLFFFVARTVTIWVRSAARWAQRISPVAFFLTAFFAVFRNKSIVGFLVCPSLFADFFDIRTTLVR